MPNESPSQARASRLAEDKQRCQEAAQRFRHRLRQGEYAGLPGDAADDLSYILPVLDAASFELADLPRGTRSAVLGLVRRLLDDDVTKRGAVDPLTSPRGEGH